VGHGSAVGDFGEVHHPGAEKVEAIRGKKGGDVLGVEEAESARTQVEPGDGKSLTRIEQGVPPGPASGLQNRGDPLSPEQERQPDGATDIGLVP
jgi:hypothetical protein